MPAKGKHRRPKFNPFARGFVVAGTGGAAIALPLFGATTATAAPAAAPAPTAVSKSSPVIARSPSQPTTRFRSAA